MDWVFENWQVIVLVASILANVLVGLGYKKAGRLLRVLIGAVESYAGETGNTKIKKDIKAASLKAGTEAGLSTLVKRLTT
jgi:hypothetical protein